MNTSFDETTTSDEVLAGRDLRGHRALITGISSGLGIETARALAMRGATVHGAVRDLAKAASAIDAALPDAQARARVSLHELDLMSLASVRRCAETLTGAGVRFDLVVANAGVMACPFAVTEEGFERQFGVNHLAHFVLVNRLRPSLKDGSRVVCVASSGHRYADVDLGDPGFERTPYDPFVAYGRSKTANVSFAVELDRRLRGRGIRAAAVHPGFIATALGRHLPPDSLSETVRGINLARERKALRPFALKTVPQGAATTLWAGVVADSEAMGGRYCENCHSSFVTTEPNLDPVSEGVRPYAVDVWKAAALWKASETWVAETF